jgi:hypothetical protein
MGGSFTREAGRCCLFATEWLRVGSTGPSQLLSPLDGASGAWVEFLGDSGGD